MNRVITHITLHGVDGIGARDITGGVEAWVVSRNSCLNQVCWASMTPCVPVHKALAGALNVNRAITVINLTCRCWIGVRGMKARGALSR